MTDRRQGWVLLFIAASAALAAAQKVVGPDDFDRAMKTIGAAMDGTREAIGSESYIEAKTPLALARQTLASTRPVWETDEEPAAVRMTREAVAALDALDKALSPRIADPAAVAATLDDVTRACDACHATYREGDEQTGYRIRSATR
jgi:hypothetical protein